MTTTSPSNHSTRRNRGHSRRTGGPAGAQATTIERQGPLPFSALLGIQGWSALDPILLASLALRAPLLLMGAHGTAKTLIAERIATALEQRFRHYNASLLNYDDLVGIPVPDEQGGLVYLGAAGAVWDAQFVFLDEINRCRPDLQNKLFPLVHERRIAGEDLTELEHRWAAINPPGNDTGLTNSYLGVEELDDALIDRFWFIVPVPDWNQIGRNERVALVRSGADASGFAEGEHAPIALVERTRTILEIIDATDGDRIADHVVTLVDQLASDGVVLSPRRARLLLRAICAVHAARVVLEGEDADLATSAELTLLHALPARATSAPPSLCSIVAANRHAWEVSDLEQGALLRELLTEPDAVRRVWLAAERGADDQTVARLVTAALATCELTADRRALAVVLTRAFADRELTPAAWSPLMELVRPVLVPRQEIHRVLPGTELSVVRELKAHMTKDECDLLETAFLSGVDPDELAIGDWRDVVARFRSHRELFGVAE